jgi:hypothetical protein
VRKIVRPNRGRLEGSPVIANINQTVSQPDKPKEPFPRLNINDMKVKVEKLDFSQGIRFNDNPSYQNVPKAQLIPDQQKRIDFTDGGAFNRPQSYKDIQAEQYAFDQTFQRRENDRLITAFEKAIMKNADIVSGSVDTGNTKVVNTLQRGKAPSIVFS